VLATHALDLEKLNREFESKKPEDILAWAIAEFKGRIAMTSSFGPESGVLLHLVSRIDPSIPVLFLETGYHFPETIQYKEDLIKLLGLKQVLDLKADSKRKAEVVKQYEGVPYEKNPDLCCQINKVEPVDKALQGFDAWMSGIKRHQTDFRKSIRIIEEYGRRGAPMWAPSNPESETQGSHTGPPHHMYKISPLANLTSREMWWYLKEHNIPKHPLYDKGYLSVGCWPCTRPVQAGDDERSGRWAGKAKTECGMHTFMEVKEEDKEGDKPGIGYSGGI
jgi:phosphoadenosine phosphosulfate reductase